MEGKPFSEFEMRTFDGLFLDFCILGGMPVVVASFIESGTFERSLQTQRQLITDYEEGIRKYAQGLDQGRILNAFSSIPFQLARENKKFQLSKVKTGARFRDYRGCIEWLETADIVNVCRRLEFPELPLRGNYAENMFKVYFGDTGPFVSMLDDGASEDLRVNKNLGVYEGALYESIVAEALTKQRYGLHYYKKPDSTLEEDFFLRTKSELVPIEVKATRGTSKSLRQLISSGTYSDISWGIKLHRGNIGESAGIVSTPYFTAFLLRRYLAKQ